MPSCRSPPSYDKFEQAINRVHRLNSRWPVTVYPIICDRSIDRKLEAMIQEKGDAAELVLDGHLIGEQSMEVNLAELLDIARKEFENGSHAVTVDEEALEKEWTPLRSELSAAATGWRLKGLELIGVNSSIPVSTNPVSAPEQEQAVPGPSRFQITIPPASSNCAPVASIQPPACLDIQGEDITLFAGLPLFDLA